MPAKRGGSSGYTRERGNSGGGTQGIGTTRSLTGSNAPAGNQIGRNASVTNQRRVQTSTSSRNQQPAAGSRVQPSQLRKGTTYEDSMGNSYTFVREQHTTIRNYDGSNGGTLTRYLFQNRRGISVGMSADEVKRLRHRGKR